MTATIWSGLARKYSLVAVGHLRAAAAATAYISNLELRSANAEARFTVHDAPEGATLSGSISLYTVPTNSSVTRPLDVFDFPPVKMRKYPRLSKAAALAEMHPGVSDSGAS